MPAVAQESDFPQQPEEEEAPDEQEAPESAPAESVPKMTPPELIEFVAAEIPEEAVPKEPVFVLFELTVRVDGTVEEATIAESAGAPFDDAALTAVKQFRFEPATRDGEPVAARIRYRYVFEAPPPPEDQAKEEKKVTEQGVLTVKLLDKDRKAIVGARLSLLDAQGRELAEAQSGSSGSASFPALAPSKYRVLVFADGYEDISSFEEVLPGQETTATYRPRALKTDASDDEDSFGATAVVDPPPREVTRRTIRREELTRVAGTRGDALRTIELLPGVSRPPAGAGVLIVRGSAPNDSQTYLEGNPVPLLYHFGGLTGFVNSRILDRLDFYPGNFSVRFGRRTGGVVDIGVRDPVTDRFHGVVDLNVIDASFVLEAPLSKKFSLAVAARRSYIDAFFGLIPLGDDVNAVAAPVYWDYQALATYRPNRKDRIRFRAYGSSDRLRLLFEEPADGDPDFRGNLDVVTWFHRFEVDWTRRISENVEQKLSLSAGPTHIAFQIGENADFDNDSIDVQGRAEWSFKLHEKLKLRTGVDWFFSPFFIEYAGLNPGQGEGDPDGGPGGLQPGATQDTVFVDTTVYYNRPALYAEFDYLPIPKWRLVPGVRVDYFSAINRFTADPRIASIFSVRKDLRIKAGVGLFSQPPEVNESSEAIGNPDLKPIQAVHVSAGADYDIADGITVGVEGFFKYLYNRVVQTEDGLDPVFTNDGTGRIYGMELSGRVEPRRRPYFGFLSYTLSRSERDDRDDPTRLFDFDQTHVLNLAVGYRLGRGWELSGTFRLASGNPSTPVLRGIYDADNDVYIPVLGTQNSVRDSYFHRLDVRAEKTWKFRLWSLAFYLDIQNVYNRMNQEGLQFNYDFTEVETVSGLPIIPSLGLRGEF